MPAVKDVMTRDVISFQEKTPLDEVAETLSRRHITGAPVLDSDGYVVGIVSEVDVFARHGQTASDVMSPNVITVGEETSLEEVAQIMAGERIRRLPVLSAGKLVGLVSRSDVLDFFAQSHWTCETCGAFQHGLTQPDSCRHCGGTSYRLDRGLPGT
jgi:CBS domain-containing protein